MNKWQSRIVARDLDEALAGVNEAPDDEMPDVALHFWLAEALRATRTGLNKRHQQQIDILLRQVRRQRGY